MGVLHTGCKTLDRLMGGGLPLGAPSLIYGIPNLGKTWCCYQISSNCTRSVSMGGLDRPVLYLDTESFFTPDVFDRFYGYFRRRWGDLPEQSRIHMRRVKNIFELGALFGTQFTIVQEESRVSTLAKFPTELQTKLAKSGEGKKRGRAKKVGSGSVKRTVQSGSYLERSEIWKLFKETNYGLLVIDSMTIPIKSVIPKGTQHLPGRGTLITFLLGPLHSIAQTFNCAILVTDHITRSPLSKTYKYGLGDPWGGQDVSYYIKYQFGLFPALKADKDGLATDGHRLRRVSRHRFPGMDESIVNVMLAKNEGYIDVPTARLREA